MPASEHQPLTRQELREELAALKTEILGAIARSADPVALALALAMPDDEPLTAAEGQAIQEALDDPGPNIPHEEVLREFGL